MQHIDTTAAKGAFKTLAATKGAQAILMTLEPGETSDDEPSNEHPRCEQWMLVLEGRGKVRDGDGKTFTVGPGSLVVIEKRELHQIETTGSRPLRTINFYVPPAYGKGGRLLPGATRAGKQTA